MPRKKATTQAPTKWDANILANALDECQRSFACHRRHIINLKKAQQQFPQEFGVEFISTIRRILMVFKREPAVDRLVQFVIAFCAYDFENPSEDETFLHQSQEFVFFLIDYLLDFSDANDKAVRFRVCQLISGLMNGLGEDTDISDELFEKLETNMLVRMQDKVPVIRAHAVMAICRCQDPTDEEDEVSQLFLRLLESDASKDVRKAVLLSIGVCDETIPAVIARMCDVRGEVRRACLAVLQHKVELDMLSIPQRVAVLKAGLNDRNNSVKRACVDLLSKNWLASCDNDVVSLISELDPVENEVVALEAASTIICNMPNMEVPTELDSVDAANAIYWRAYCENFKSLRPRVDDDHLDDVLPSLSDFCDILRASLGDTFIARQMVLLTRNLDLSDEVGRRKLSALLREVVTNPAVVDSVIPEAVALLRNVHPSESEIITVILELVSDITEVLDQGDDTKSSKNAGKMKEIAKVKSELKNAIKLKDQAVRKEKYELAAKYKKSMAKLEEQLEGLESSRSPCEFAWVRSLMLVSELLEYTKRNTSHGGLAGLLEYRILPAVQHSYQDIRVLGIKTLGQYCLLDASQAWTYADVFMNAIENDEVELKFTAVRVLFDLLMVFKHTTVEGEPIEAVANIMLHLVEQLNSSDADMRTLCGEGFAKLVFVERCDDVDVITKLVTLYFDPATADDSRLRQCLSVFFPSYAFTSVEHQETLASVFIHILREVIHAPQDSSLAKTNLANLGQFLFFMTDVMQSPSINAPGLHEAIGCDIAKEVLAIESSNTAEIKQWTRLLSMLNLDASNNKDRIAELKAFHDAMKESITDKAILKHLEKLDTLITDAGVSSADVTAAAASTAGDNESPFEGVGVDIADIVATHKADRAKFLESKPVPAKKTAGQRRKPAARRAAVKKVVEEEYESSSDESASEEAVADSPSPVVRRRAPRRAAAAAKTNKRNSGGVSAINTRRVSATVVNESDYSSSEEDEAAESSSSFVKKKKSGRSSLLSQGSAAVTIDDEISDALSSSEGEVVEKPAVVRRGGRRVQQKTVTATRSTRSRKAVLGEIDNLLED